jgi:hypothetical protein
MATDFQPIVAGPDVVGMVDHPGRQPEHALFQRGKTGETLFHEFLSLGWNASLPVHRLGANLWHVLPSI